VLLDRTARRSFQVAVHVEPFEESPGVTDALELVAVEEQVVPAADLAFTTRPRGRRDREPESRLELEELADDRPLADPGRAREDQQDAQDLPPISRIA
jgi:hypothetical protein